MNPVRAGVFVVWLYGLTVVLGLLGSPLLLADRPAHMGLIRFWARAVVWGMRVFAGVRLEIRGAQHRPAGAALIGSKHGSIIDTIAPLTFLEDPCYVAKQELLALPIYGWHARRMGLIPVDRQGQSKAVRQLMHDAKDRLALGRQVVIFPEGTRKRPGEPPDYKPGVAALYRDLGLPCTPMATNSAVHCSAVGVPLKPGVIVFEFLPAIPAGLKRADFMRSLEEAVETATNALYAEGI